MKHMAPTLATACAALPPEGAAFSLSGLTAKRFRGLGTARRQNPIS